MAIFPCALHLFELQLPQVSNCSLELSSCPTTPPLRFMPPSLMSVSSESCFFTFCLTKLCLTSTAKRAQTKFTCSCGQVEWAPSLHLSRLGLTLSADPSLVTGSSPTWSSPIWLSVQFSPLQYVMYER